MLLEYEDPLTHPGEHRCAGEPAHTAADCDGINGAGYLVRPVAVGADPYFTAKPNQVCPWVLEP